MPPPIPTIPSPRNDQITGTSADDIIDALAGNDVVRAGDGDDVVLGNRGNDKLFGEDGSDRLSGDQGNDDIDGGDGLDTAVYTGSRDDYQVTTDANGVTEVKDLRGQGSKTPDGIDHVVNTEFFDFNGDVFQLQDGVLVPYEPPPVADGFWGQTIDYTFRFPDFNIVYYNTEVTVGSGVEISGIHGQAGFIPVDFTDDQIAVDLNAFDGFAPFSFIGFSVFDEYNVLPDIIDVNIDPSTNLPGFDESRITFDADHINVNFSGISFDPSHILTLDVVFA
jgi:hypothetical protein